MSDTGTTTFSGDTTGTGIIKGFLVKMAPEGSNADSDALNLGKNQFQKFFKNSVAVVPDEKGRLREPGKKKRGLFGMKYADDTGEFVPINVSLGGGSTAPKQPTPEPPAQEEYYPDEEPAPTRQPAAKKHGFFGGLFGGEGETEELMIPEERVEEPTLSRPAVTQPAPAEDTSTPTEVTITSLNGNGEPTDLTVPYDPQRIAILDMASLDILDALGLGDRVVGTASTSLDYLQRYINDEVENLGTIKEADLEAVMACEPDVIFIGGRLASSYDSLSEIAPVVYLATDTETGVVASVEKNARTIASLFGLEDQVDQLMEGFDSRIQALAGAAEGHTAIVGLVTSGSFNVLGNDGRCSIIGREVGYENIGVDAEIDTSTHGNEASFEFIVEKDPEYIFVLDRDAAIQTEGAQLAQEVMENDLVKGTQAYQNGNIVYLAHPAVWYTAEGGITALDLMLQDLESELLEE